MEVNSPGGPTVEMGATPPPSGETSEWAQAQAEKKIAQVATGNLPRKAPAIKKGSEFIRNIYCATSIILKKS